VHEAAPRYHRAGDIGVGATCAGSWMSSPKVSQHWLRATASRLLVGDSPWVRPNRQERQTWGRLWEMLRAAARKPETAIMVVRVAWCGPLGRPREGDPCTRHGQARRSRVHELPARRGTRETTGASAPQSGTGAPVG
jgi:hypothetical protein